MGYFWVENAWDVHITLHYNPDKSIVTYTQIVIYLQTTPHDEGYDSVRWTLDGKAKDMEFSYFQSGETT